MTYIYLEAVSAGALGPSFFLRAGPGGAPAKLLGPGPGRFFWPRPRRGHGPDRFSWPRPRRGRGPGYNEIMGTDNFGGNFPLPPPPSPIVKSQKFQTPKTN